MWKINNILLSVYGIIPGQVEGEGIAVKGIFDLPKRMGITYKDWDDENSVQPYVDADEIFLEGRDVIFQGILEGTKAETEYNIEYLKLAIGSFNSVVPFETPYGTYFVYVKKITPKIYNGIATVLIEFREPEVGVTSTPVVSDTIYYSAVYSETAIKNNCGVGYYGLEVSLSSTLGQFTSTISQLAADQLAIDWVRENKQNTANAALFSTYCAINPPIYYNAELTNSLKKNDCGLGYFGSSVSYTILADIYSSDGRTDPTASQAKADAKAQAAMDLILTQVYANTNGYCSLNGTLILKSNTGNGAYRGMLFEVGEAVPIGSVYHLMVYSHDISYTAIFGDTPTSVVSSLISLINETTEAQWNDNNSAPLTGTIGFKPFASILWSANPNQIWIELNYQNQFAGWVIN